MRTLKFLGIGLVISLASVNAQKGVDSGTRYGKGEDSVRCVQNLSLYSEDFKNKNYAEAYNSWLVVINECPQAHINLYIDGPRLVKTKMEKATAAEKEEYYQLLMRVYDLRMQYFGNDRRKPAPAIKGDKAIDMLEFKRSEPAVVKEAYGLLNESVDGVGNASQPIVLISFMNIATQLYQENAIDASTYIGHYTKVTDMTDARLKDSNISESVRKALEQVKNASEDWFSKTDAANCENLENIFTPQLEENKLNLEWLKRVNTLLARKLCEDSELLYKTAEYQHNIEPSSGSAYGLARMNLKSANYETALTYFNQAVELSDDNEQKGQFLNQIATIQLAQGNYPQARTYALRAIEVKPDWGAPYIVIGQAYAAAAGNIGENEFEHKAVYWAAVDKLMRAKSVDASVADRANELIRSYSAQFPPIDEIFFQGHKEGDSFTVGGWINERTTIRKN
ncbi:MAG: tetratricopeptide repeat protein [Cytophagaceae bacterium]|jgi:tetratricopeptide (TPR) repeat protein|nr:tetratricopeptide repeat protein [Cytophagaceae bacterium]